MVDNLTFCDCLIRMTAILLVVSFLLFWLMLTIGLLSEKGHSNIEKEKNKMEKKKIKEAKKNRKNLVKRIKNMTPEQFDAYYETLVEIYGRECFHKEFAKRYVRNLWGKTRCEETVELAKKKSNR